MAPYLPCPCPTLPLLAALDGDNACQQRVTSITLQPAPTTRSHQNDRLRLRVVIKSPIYVARAAGSDGPASNTGRDG